MTIDRQYFYGFTAANGVPFLARRVDSGPSNHGRPCIEFYDCRYSHGKYGQFVSRYWISTLRESVTRDGICLDGAVPYWRVDGANFARVVAKLCWEA